MQLSGVRAYQAESTLWSPACLRRPGGGQARPFSVPRVTQVWSHRQVFALVILSTWKASSFLRLSLLHFLLFFPHISEALKWLTSSPVYQASVQCSSDCGTKRKVSGLVYRAETLSLFLSLSFFIYVLYNII